MDAPEGFDRECFPGGLEVRTTGADAMIARAAGDETRPQIAGLGSVAESPTTIEGLFTDWDEEVAAGAWSETIKGGDIRSMFNHDTAWLLGRTTAGTLRLSEDDAGLRYEVDINPDDANAMSVHAKVARGDVDGSSVWFRVVRQEWTYPTDDNQFERPKRRILEAMLFETGPVVFPAFTQTTSTARSLRPLDSVLRAAGVEKATRRAKFADRLISGEDLESELRALFASAPDLAEAVCECSTNRADDAPPPTGADAPSPGSADDIETARALLELRRRSTAA